jgi:hypothetical protein
MARARFSALIVFGGPLARIMSGHLRLICLDGYILKPLWLLYLILAGVYLYAKELRVGLFVAAMGFLFGVVSRFLRGSIATSDFDAEPSPAEDDLPDSYQPMTLEEASAASKAVSAAGYILGLTGTILSAHHGLSLYLAIPLGILVAWLGAHLLGLVWVAFSVWLEGKDDESD